MSHDVRPDPSFPVDHVLQHLLEAKNKPSLEGYRTGRATNRVYRIPVNAHGEKDVFVKLLPGPVEILRTEWKIRLRNVMYGERDIPKLRSKVGMEIERYAEWREEGFHVPRLIPTRFPNVRVIEALDHPTLREVLSGNAPLEVKLDAVGLVARELSSQHQVAMERGLQRLVHREPTTKNILVDRIAEEVYWIDLEQPAEYPGMTMEALVSRALRVFLYSAVFHESEQVLDELLHRFVAHYRHTYLLWAVVNSIQDRAFAFRLMRSLGFRKRIYDRQCLIGDRLADALQRAEAN